MAKLCWGNTKTRSLIRYTLSSRYLQVDEDQCLCFYKFEYNNVVMLRYLNLSIRWRWWKCTAELTLLFFQLWYSFLKILKEVYIMHKPWVNSFCLRAIASFPTFAWLTQIGLQNYWIIDVPVTFIGKFLSLFWLSVKPNVLDHDGWPFKCIKWSQQITCVGT